MSSDVVNTFDNVNKQKNMDKTFFNGMMDIVKHRKFKWCVILVLLLVAIFYYLKTQNKNKTDNNTELNTGLPKCICPPFFGVTPPTNFVPYFIACSA